MSLDLGEGPVDVNSREAALWSETISLKSQLEQYKNFAGWVDSWVSHPVGSYSVAALDGLFGMTRDRLAMLPDAALDPKPEPPR